MNVCGSSENLWDLRYIDLIRGTASDAADKAVSKNPPLLKKKSWISLREFLLVINKRKHKKRKIPNPHHSGWQQRLAKSHRSALSERWCACRWKRESLSRVSVTESHPQYMVGL